MSDPLGLGQEELLELLARAQEVPEAREVLREIEADMSELLKPRVLTRHGERPMLTPKQVEFLEAMVGSDEAACFAGNQSGKTATLGQYVSWVALGEYPSTVDVCIKTVPWQERVEWFDPHVHGTRLSLEPAEEPRWVKHITVEREIHLRKFFGPATIWVSSHSGSKLRETLQDLLFGQPPLEENIGVGLIPRDRIITWKKAHMSVPDLLDYVMIRSAYGGSSKIATKMASQGEEGYTGAQVHLVVLDEKHPMEVLTEALARTTNTGGIVLVGYTPRDGRTPLTEHFKNPEQRSERKRLVTMSVADATFYSKQRQDEIKSKYPVHEQRARFYGLETLGQGLVLPFLRDQIACSRMELSPWWYYGKGCDFGGGGGSGHPTAGVWCAHDRDNDVIYLYGAYKSMATGTTEHASAFRKPEDIWMFWPHDGLKTDSRGTATAQYYEEDGVRMWPESARYLDETGGPQGDSKFILELTDRIKTGRFKVFADLENWFSEQEQWYYDKGKPYPLGDDLMKATKSAMIMVRHWTQRETHDMIGGVVQYEIADVI